MKIAHIICKFPPYKGGMGQVAYEQVKRLSRDHQVVVFTLKEKVGKVIDVGNINFKIIYLKSWLRFGNGGFCPQLLWKLEGFDIIQLHYPFFGAQEILWLGKILGILKKQKLVIFYHMDAMINNWFLKFLTLPSKLIKNSLFKKVDRIICASIDYVENSKIKKIYQKYKDKFAEVPFGVKELRIKDYELRIREKLNIKLDEKVILFVGGLDKAHYFKGVDVLINAFKKIIENINSCVSPVIPSEVSEERANKVEESLDCKKSKCSNPQSRDSSTRFVPVGISLGRNDRARNEGVLKNTKLIIVGGGDLKKNYEKLAHELNLQDKIIFAGGVSNDELGNYYQICDLFVLPSINKAEAFGLVLLEAKSFGKAVIGSDLPGVREVVGDKISGLLVKPGDIGDLAEKIEIILKDDKIREQFGKAGKEQVVDKYNWDKHIMKLEKIYEKLFY